MEKRTKHFSQKFIAHRLLGAGNYGKIKFLKILLKHKLGGEYEITKFLKTVLKSGDVFLDIGANMGQYLLRLSEVKGRSVQLHAFEPSGTCVKILMRHFAGYDNVTVIHSAVSDYTGNAVLSVPVIKGIPIDTQGTINTKNRETSYSNFQSENVAVTTVDEYVRTNSFERVDFIKTDTEGDDVRVITGAVDTIKKFLPVIITEDILTGEPMNFLEETGYKDFIARKDGNIERIKTSGDSGEIIKDVVLYIHDKTISKYNSLIR